MNSLPFCLSLSSAEIIHYTPQCFVFFFNFLFPDQSLGARLGHWPHPILSKTKSTPTKTIKLSSRPPGQPPLSHSPALDFVLLSPRLASNLRRWDDGRAPLCPGWGSDDCKYLTSVAFPLVQESSRCRHRQGQTTGPKLHVRLPGEPRPPQEEAAAEHAHTVAPVRERLNGPAPAAILTQRVRGD